MTNLCWIGQVIGVGFGRMGVNEVDDALDLELIEHWFRVHCTRSLSPFSMKQI